MSSDESSESYLSCPEEEPQSASSSTVRGHLVIGVGVSVNTQQMKVKESQGNILIHRNGELSCESLKECVATVLKPNILDVARVRHDSLVLFVVKFGSQASLESFFKSLHNEEFQHRLKGLLKHHFPQDTAIDVNTELYLDLFSAKNGTVTQVLVDGPAFKLEDLQPTNGKKFNIKEHLAELLTHLSKATAHWFNVGLFLNVDYGRLKSIRHENPHSQSNCLREMLAAWLHKTEDASPMKVAFALKESKLVELAYEFASKYGVSLKEVTEYERLMAEDNEGLDSKERRFFQLNSEFSKLEEREKVIREEMKYLTSRQDELKIECEKKNANRAWLDSLAKSTLDAEALKVVERLIADNDTAEIKKQLATIEEDIKVLKVEDRQMKDKLSQLEQQEKTMHSQSTHGSSTLKPKPSGDHGDAIPTKRIETRLEDLHRLEERKSYHIQETLKTLTTTTGKILTILEEKDFKVVQVSQPGECKQQ